MVKLTPPSNRVDLLQGTLDLLILQTLQWGPQHGYSISTAIRAGASHTRTSSSPCVMIAAGGRGSSPHAATARTKVNTSERRRIALILPGAPAARGLLRLANARGDGCAPRRFAGTMTPWA